MTLNKLKRELPEGCEVDEYRDTELARISIYAPTGFLWIDRQAQGIHEWYDPFQKGEKARAVSELYLTVIEGVEVGEPHA